MVLPLQDVDRDVRRSDRFELVGQLIPLKRQVHVAGLPLDARLERYRAVLDRNAQWRGDVLHHRDALGVQDVSCDRVQDQHVAGIAHVVVGLDHQDVGVHPGLREMPVGGREPDVDRGVFRQVVAVVVGRLVSGNGNDADEHNEQARHENGCGPTHYRSADFPPEPALGRPFGFIEPNSAAEKQHGRSERDRDRHDHDHADRDRSAHGAEVGQPRETEAVRGPGDRQARTHDDGCDGLEGGVVGVVLVQTHAAIFTVAAECEDAVVGARRDRQHRQDVPGERRQPEHVVDGED